MLLSPDPGRPRPPSTSDVDGRHDVGVASPRTSSSSTSGGGWRRPLRSAGGTSGDKAGRAGPRPTRLYRHVLQAELALAADDDLSPSSPVRLLSVRQRAYLSPAVWDLLPASSVDDDDVPAVHGPAPISEEEDFLGNFQEVEQLGLGGVSHINHFHAHIVDKSCGVSMEGDWEARQPLRETQAGDPRDLETGAGPPPDADLSVRAADDAVTYSPPYTPPNPAPRTQWEMEQESRQTYGRCTLYILYFTIWLSV